LRSQKSLIGLGLVICITLHLHSSIGGCPLRYSQRGNYVLLLLLSLSACMVHKIRYSPVADIVDYFKEIRTLAGPIECTSMVTQIALYLGFPEMVHLSYIERDVPILGLDHFVHVHILCEEPDYTISILYARGSKALMLPDLTFALYSCHQLTLQLTWMGDVCHSYFVPPRTR
jgi:hypothetical protein